MKYHRKNKYVIMTEDGKYSIVKMAKSYYHIKEHHGDGWGLGEYILNSREDIATFYTVKSAKEYIANRFYKEV